MQSKWPVNDPAACSPGDRLSDICERFQTAWQSGSEPSLEAFLSEVASAEQADLLGHLLPLEIEFRQARGDPPTPAECLERFAAFRPTVERLLGEGSTRRFERQADRSPAEQIRDDIERTSSEPRGAPATAPPVRRRFGQYQILGPLGRGGMGIVYRAVHIKLKRFAALKLLPAENVHATTHLARFLREMEAFGQFDHPHIVRAYDAGEIDGVYYLAMELVEGCDLARLVRRDCPLRVCDACECIRQAAIGLQHVMDRGLAHRDIKPSNLLIARTGTLKIADLGLSQFRDQTPAEELTATGCFVGSIDYLAPEQADGKEPPDIRADLYSLGCTLYRLLTGRLPFAAPEYPSVSAKLFAHAHVAPAAVAELRPDLPAGLAAIVDRLLAKRPGDRYSTPQEAAAAIEPYCGGHDLARLIADSDSEPTASHEAYADEAPRADDRPPPLHPLPAARRKRALLALGGAVVLAAALAWGGYPFFFGSGEGDRRSDSSQATAASVWTKTFGPNITELQWPGYAGEGYWQVTEGADHLVVTADKVRLIALGELEPSARTIAVDLLQEPWRGSAGLFFGYRIQRIQGRPTATFQLIRIVRSLDQRRRPCIELRRRKVYLLPDSGSVVGGVEQGMKLPMPPRGEWKRLEAQLTEAGMQDIRWAGQEIPNVVGETAEKAFAREDYIGPWGIFHQGGTTWFAHPELKSD